MLTLLVLYILNVKAAPQYPVSRCKIIIKRMVSKPGGLNVIEVIPPQSVVFCQFSHLLKGIETDDNRPTKPSALLNCGGLVTRFNQ